MFSKQILRKYTVKRLPMMVYENTYFLECVFEIHKWCSIVFDNCTLHNCKFITPTTSRVVLKQTLMVECKGADTVVFMEPHIMTLLNQSIHQCKRAIFPTGETSLIRSYKCDFKGVLQTYEQSRTQPEFNIVVSRELYNYIEEPPEKGKFIVIPKYPPGEKLAYLELLHPKTLYWRLRK